jgi:hypothetical protein
MNEISMVRRLLAEPAPRPHVVAEGRKRLLGSPARGPRGARTIRRPAFRNAVGLGLTGAVAAAVLAVATLGPEVGTHPGDGGSDTIDTSARTVLLAAATRAESAPTSGTYWHVRRMSWTTLPRELGQGDDRYTVEQLTVTEEWTKRSGPSWWGRRQWVRPKSPEDEAAWRRDGAPSKWCMGETDTEPSEPICLHTAPGTASVMRVGQDTFVVADETELTFEQLQRLPADADALHAWVVDAVKDDLDPAASADIIDCNVADVLGNLLVDVPVPPGVRAAAYRALAEMPNVTSIGPTQDRRGRAGVGILVDAGDSAAVLFPGGHTFEPGELIRTLIIDPDTSHVLADQTDRGEGSELVNETLLLEVGWTDEEPQLPALP